jgi:hypothetical protein
MLSFATTLYLLTNLTRVVHGCLCNRHEAIVVQVNVSSAGPVRRERLGQYVQPILTLELPLVAIRQERVWIQANALGRGRLPLAFSVLVVLLLLSASRLFFWATSPNASALIPTT